jgi:hypothetical protein
MPVVLHGCQTWSVTLRDGLGLGCLKIGGGEKYLALEGRNNVVVEKTACWGTLWRVLLTKYYSGDQIKKNEMGGACGTYGGEER